MQSIFTFGKKRRVASKKSKKSRKGGRKSRKGGRKPPSRLLKMCKRLGVRTTVKRGSKRVYKSTALLMKMCKKKLRMRKMRKSRFGSSCNQQQPPAPAFGRRRRSKKSKKKSYVSKKSAMKAFKSFYNKNCKPGLKRSRFGSSKSKMMNYSPMMDPPMGPRRFGRSRFGEMDSAKPPKPPMGPRFGRSRFGGGGNPPLMSSMGFEFCPDGNGGVLMGSGLFPTGCTPMEAETAFGKRRRRKMYKYRNVVAACSKLKKKQCRTSPNCSYVKNRGCKGRSGTRKGMVYEGPSMY